MLRSHLKNLFFFFLLSGNSFSDQVYLTLIKESSLLFEPRDIIINEDIAYIITDGALYSYSTTDPYNLKQTSYSNLAGTRSIAFTGRTAYVFSGGDGIDLYDFTKSPPVKKNTILTNGTIVKLVIDNGYMYVVNQDMGLQVYDVNISDFPLLKNTQILPDKANGIFIKDKKAYVTGSNANLSIFDVADVAKLPIIGSYSNGVNFYETYVDGNYAFVPQGTTGVQVINISKLPFPEWVANIFARKFAKQVVASNFYIWVADDKSVEGFFNKDPKTFYFAGNYKNNAVINRIALIDGKYIFVCSGDKKLKVLKIDYKY